MHVVEQFLLMEATLSEPLKERDRQSELVDRVQCPLCARFQDPLWELARCRCKDLLLFSGSAAQPPDLLAPSVKMERDMTRVLDRAVRLLRLERRRKPGDRLCERRLLVR
ncbi:hypothetical protein [Mumia zhuanghuii]|uniref:Uncharacterized protein n=1 Tax=Mumia zhuanghuii TaxID=2585211 RepID=A0A5C4M667_9ACTN|nr:hypothetical protein [Mumia zhuanghuii]TNC28421.1 hypothetical protein FHE65_33920 [Mumia zhuanghuii]